MELFATSSCRKAILLVVGSLAVLTLNLGCGPHAYVTSQAVTSVDGRMHAFSKKDAYVCGLTADDRPICTEAEQK